MLKKAPAFGGFCRRKRLSPYLPGGKQGNQQGITSVWKITIHPFEFIVTCTPVIVQHQMSTKWLKDRFPGSGDELALGLRASSKIVPEQNLTQSLLFARTGRLLLLRTLFSRMKQRQLVRSTRRSETNAWRPSRSLLRKSKPGGSDFCTCDDAATLWEKRWNSDIARPPCCKRHGDASLPFGKWWWN